MPGMTDSMATRTLNYLAASQPVLPANFNLFLGLFTTAPTQDTPAATGAVEVSGSGYARVQIGGTLVTNALTTAGVAVLNFASVPAWIVAGMQVRNMADAGAGTTISLGARVVSTTSTTVTITPATTGSGVANAAVISFSAFDQAAASTGSQPTTQPAQMVNTNAAITFPQAGGTWGTVIAFGLFDAVTAGNLLAWDYLGNFKWLPFSSGTGAAGAASFASPAHGFAASDNIVVTTKYGGALGTASAGGYNPPPMTVNSVTTDTFTAVGLGLSTTGNGLCRKITAQVIPANVTAAFAAGSMTLTLA